MRANQTVRPSHRAEPIPINPTLLITISITRIILRRHTLHILATKHRTLRIATSISSAQIIARRVSIALDSAAADVDVGSTSAAAIVGVGAWDEGELIGGVLEVAEAVAGVVLGCHAGGVCGAGGGAAGGGGADWVAEVVAFEGRVRFCF